MSASIDPLPHETRALRLHRQLAAIWATGPGLQRLASVNHTVIGLRFIVTAFVIFAIADLGMLTGAARNAAVGSWTPRPTTRSHDAAR